MSSAPPSPRSVGVVVVAAGQGTRLGGEPKQFRSLAGVPLLLRTLRPFLSHPEVGTVVCVLPPDDAAEPPDWLARLAGDRLQIAAGGAERADSVRAGLALLVPEESVVLIHDGARPFPSRTVIDAVIAAARSGVAAIAAVPVTDTVKEQVPASDPPMVGRTVPRTGLWRAQTPQGFPRDLLERAHAEAAGTVTDDAMVIEGLGLPVRLIADSPLNLKVTTPDDFLVAEALAARGEGS